MYLKNHGDFCQSRLPTVTTPTVWTIGKIITMPGIEVQTHLPIASWYQSHQKEKMQ